MSINTTTKLLLTTIGSAGIVLGVMGIAPLSAIAGTITFSDSTFNNADWDLTSFSIPNIDGVHGGTGTVSATQSPSGGNPGEYRYILNSVNAISDYTAIEGFHINNTAIYNPQTQGAISSIDYSEDAINFGWGDGHATGLALKQNGQFYFTYTYRNFLITPALAWKNYQLTSLTETDFINVKNAAIKLQTTNPIDYPDFSASGSPIEFGFFRGNSGASSYSLPAGIDNWRVTINHEEAKKVPEPSSVFGLLAAGALGAGSIIKNKLVASKSK